MPIALAVRGGCVTNADTGAVSIPLAGATELVDALLRDWRAAAAGALHAQPAPAADMQPQPHWGTALPLRLTIAHARFGAGAALPAAQ